MDNPWAAVSPFAIRRSLFTHAEMTHDHSHHDHSHDDHDHDHAHGSGHAHGHVHAPKNFGRAFALGLALNLGFLIIEVVCGFLSNSVALLADAGHNLSDVLGLAAAWLAAELAKRAPTARFSYGWRGSSILAALFNATLLLVTVGGLSWEAIERLISPEPVAEKIVMVVAAIGIAANGFTAWLFVAGNEDDINLRGAFLHMAADAFVSVGVVLSGLVILLTGWLRLDAIVSLAINALIVWSTWGLMRESLSMSMAAVPKRIDPAELRAFLLLQPGVASVHDLHVWPMSTTEVAMTCHLVMPAGHPGDAFLHHLALELAKGFRIVHPTVQIEIDPHLSCALAPADVV